MLLAKGSSLDPEDHGHGLPDLDDPADLAGPGALPHLPTN
jgi:hypothetical protein